MNTNFSDKGKTKTALTGRERVLRALEYKEVDRVALDLGGTFGTGAHVSFIAKLRQRLGLEGKNELVNPPRHKDGGQAHARRIKVIEPYQMLGEVAADLRDALGIDIVNLPGPKNIFGFENTDFKLWRTFDGTDVLVPGKFNTEPEPNGDILQYPEGDKSAPASARMPKGGCYFESIIRQEPIDEANLNPADNLEEFKPISDEDLEIYEQRANELYQNTDLAITAEFPGTGFGDITKVTAPDLKHPKGIRSIEEWYISTVTRKEYIKEVFAGQAEITLKNLERIYQAVGNKVHIVLLDTTDLAAQDTLFCSPQGYRELYLPFSKKLNDWIHSHTKWKTMKHCCGCCEPLIEGFIEAGFDILSPVQTSAKGMDPKLLIDKYGGRIVLWGGVDAQPFDFAQGGERAKRVEPQTLISGKPDEVRRQVAERLQIFNKTNGFVFSTVHNIQCNTPVENVLAMFEALARRPDLSRETQRQGRRP